MQYEIIKTLLVLPKTRESDLFHIEVNIISWYGKEPRLDIRKWSDDRKKAGKGLSLTNEEARAIIDVINQEVKHDN